MEFKKNEERVDILTIVLIAVALAVDCFAVSVANGITLKKVHIWPILKMSLLFGFFQGLMPIIGWLAGVNFRTAIEQWDHWIALIILSILGLKMIYEGFSEDENQDIFESGKSWKSLILLAFATSIDALATGIIFVPFPEILLQAVVLIGIISFVFSFAGNLVGLFFGRKFNLKVEVFGGIALIVIGLKIFIEHTLF